MDTNLSRAVKGSQIKNQPLKRDKSKNIDTSIAELRAYEFLVRQQEAKEWIEEMVGEKLPPGTANFCDNLRDGVILAKLAKLFDPQSVTKIHMSTGTVLKFMAVDNIAKFLQACRNIHLPSIYLFEITDLWELKGVPKVVSCLHTLANFLAQNGKAIKMKNLEAAGLKFDKEELERAWRDLEEMDNSGSSVVFTSMSSTGDDDEDDEKRYESEDDDHELDKALGDQIASPDFCILEGEGLSRAICGQVNQFTIRARDEDEKDLTVGGEKFEVKLFYKNSSTSSVHPVIGTVVDLQNGTYQVNYTPEMAGEYSMEIILVDAFDDEEEPELFMLKGCPLKVTAHASPNSDPSKSELNGLGLSSATAGAETTFTLLTRDQFGNVKTTGGESFSAKLKSGETEVDAIVTDCEDGTYKFTYTCPKSGEYDLQVYLNGEAAFDKKSVQVKDAGVSDPSNTQLHGIDSLVNIIAGKPQKFSIHAKDKLGNDRSSGGEKFTVKLVNRANSSEEIQVAVDDTNDGKYQVEFTVCQSGEYDLVIELEGSNVKTIQSTVHDTGVTDPTKTTIVDNDDFKNAKAGQQKSFTIVARDQYGNQRAKGGDSFVMPVISKSSMETLKEDSTKFVDNQDGTYTVTYTVEVAGEYGAQLMLKSVVQSSGAIESSTGDEKKRALSNLLNFLKKYKYDNIEGFPVDLNISDSGVTSAKNTQFGGKGLAGVELGSTNTFEISTFDTYGNARTSGGDTIAVKLINDKLKVNVDKITIDDQSNGTYNVTYTPSHIGDYRLEVSINGEPVDNIPHVIRVHAISLKEISDEALYDLEPYNWLASLSGMIALEDDDDLTSKINELRQKLIRQLKENSLTEKEVDELERRIQLLINNRVKIEEVMKHQSRMARLFGRSKPKQVEKVDDQEQKKRLQQLQVYSRMFYLLQTEPKYLSRIFYYVPTEKLDKFLDTIILSLFGFAFSPREEYLILRLFQETVALEASKATGEIRSFFNNSSGILPKMIMSYTRRLQGQAFLQKVLYDKIIDPILSDKTLNLELAPQKILRSMNPNEPSTVTAEKALENSQVKEALDNRKRRLTEICKNFLFTLIDNIKEIPYGLRWICKELSNEMKKRYPNASEDDLAHGLTFLIFFRFLNPAIAAPDAFSLTKKKISMEMRNNLVAVSKVLSNLVSNIQFAPNDPYAIMNEWIGENYRPVYIEQVIKSMTSVEEPEEELGVTQYMEFTVTKTPTITITWNEVYSIHALLVEKMTKVCPENEDPLRMVLKSITAVPDQLEENEEVAIQLVNPTGKASSSLDSGDKPNITELYAQTRSNFKKILRLLPPDHIGVGILATIESADRYAQYLFEQKSQLDVAQTLKEKSKAVRDAIVQLENEKVLSKDDEYRKLLIDITNEIRNQRDLKKKQIVEHDRLIEALTSLEKHHSYLKDKIDGLSTYIVETTNKDWDTSAAKKSFKFSYKHLADKHGVIESSSLNKLQQKAIKFKISMTSPGKFNVDATLGGSTVQTIEVVLNDLLDKQAKKQRSVEYDDVVLNVDKTIEILNKLFSKK